MLVQGFSSIRDHSNHDPDSPRSSLLIDRVPLVTGHNRNLYCLLLLIGLGFLIPVTKLRCMILSDWTSKS